MRRPPRGHRDPRGGKYGNGGRGAPPNPPFPPNPGNANPSQIPQLPGFNPQNTPNPNAWKKRKPGDVEMGNTDQRPSKKEKITTHHGRDDQVQWLLPGILESKYSAAEMKKTMDQAKVLLTSYKRFESLRSKPTSPDDTRSVWRFLLKHQQNLNSGKMCYFMHQAGFDLDTDGDTMMKSGNVSCGCYDKSKAPIPECYLLLLFYFITAARIDNGLFDFD